MMALISLVLLAVLGFLGVANFIIAKRPAASRVVAKLAPYQGVLGVVALVWGVWSVLTLLTNIGAISTAPIYMIVSVATVVVYLGLGLTMGAGLLRPFVKHESAVQKFDSLYARLLPMQTLLGAAAIVIAGYGFLRMIF